MDILNSLLSPISIAFAVIILGYYFGRIKIWGISLDLSGVLISAVFVGWFIGAKVPLNNIQNMSEFHKNMKFFSSFGTALFVSVIGITAGYAVDVRRRKDLKAVLIGSFMVASAFVTMKVILLLDSDISFSKLLGSLCGALTSTPGLSAANELTNIITEEATLGYGCTYLFGVTATVLFVQSTIRKSCKTYYDEIQSADSIADRAALGGLIQIGSTTIIGRMLGSIDFFGFSLGNSGGILCMGIVIGLILKKYFRTKIASAKVLANFRNMGLVLFFVGNGIPAGMQLCSEFDIKIVLYGAVMTIVPILLGLLL